MTIPYFVGLLLPNVLFLLLCSIAGIAFAHQPLNRMGYWKLIGLQIGAIIALAGGIVVLNRALETIDLPEAVYVSLLVCSASLYFATFSFGFYLEGRRMMDAGGSRWGALLGVIPFSFVVFGLSPTNRRLSPTAEIAETFK